MIHSSTLKTLIRKSYLLPIFLLMPFSVYAADADNCTITGKITYTGIPSAGLNSQYFLFTQTTGSNTYTGGNINVRIDLNLQRIAQTLTPATNLAADEIDKLFKDIVADTTWSRGVSVYSNTNKPYAPNTALISSTDLPSDNFKDLVDGGDLSINLRNLTPYSAPIYVENPKYQQFTYLIGIRHETFGIPTNRNQIVSVDYPLTSKICTVPTGTVDTTYTLKYTYPAPTNQGPNMVFLPNVSSADSNTGEYTFHIKVDFTRTLNLAVNTEPARLDFGQIPSSQFSEQDLKIDITGVPANSSSQVSYQFSGAPSWATLSIMKDSVDVTSVTETVNAGTAMNRKVRIQPTAGATGDIDARLRINVTLN